MGSGIQKDSFMPVAYFKKETYTAGFKGMRYKVYKKKMEEAEVLEAVIWPEPFCCDKTPEEKKQYQQFLFSEEGIEACVDWLNEQYTSQIARWKRKGGM